jgi:hypothetical protein
LPYGLPGRSAAGAISLAIAWREGRHWRGNFGHRQSDDLDFFTRIPGLLDQAEQRRIADDLRGLDADAQVDIFQPQTIHAVVLGCRLSVFGLGGQWLSPAVQVSEGFGLATVAEIAAMKLIAVSTRSAKKDFFDIHALSERGYSAERMFAALSGLHPGEIDIDVGHHVVRALTDFGDAELDPDPVVLNGATWNDAKRAAEQVARDLQRHLNSMRMRG